jgi:protein-tyrosine phosphatase
MGSLSARKDLDEGGRVRDQSLRVAMICTGNICRSPMAEVVLRQIVAEDPSLYGRVDVTSAGVANWHVGSPMDTRARNSLDRAGFHMEGTPGAYADRDYLDRQDVVVVMTREHFHEVRRRLTNRSAEVVMLRNLLEPGLDRDVADPYYGGDDDFDECLELLSRGVRRLTSGFRQRLDADSSEA